MEKNAAVMIPARIVHKQEKVVTVRLDDGFANVEVVVYEDKIVAAK